MIAVVRCSCCYISNGLSKMRMTLTFIFSYRVLVDMEDDETSTRSTRRSKLHDARHRGEDDEQTDPEQPTHWTQDRPTPPSAQIPGRPPLGLQYSTETFNPEENSSILQYESDDDRRSHSKLQKRHQTRSKLHRPGESRTEDEAAERSGRSPTTVEDVVELIPSKKKKPKERRKWWKTRLFRWGYTQHNQKRS